MERGGLGVESAGDLAQAPAAGGERKDPRQRELRAALLGRLRREDRTLQGYAVRVMVEVLRAIGSDPEWGTDLRNECAVEWCRALASTRDERLRDGISVW